MRHGLGFLLALAVIGLFGLGESEAACRAEGEYRVTGPNFNGRAQLTQTTSDESGSSGTVDRGSVGGTLAFGGSVIMFEAYDFLHPTLDLNLTLGIRADSLVRP